MGRSPCCSKEDMNRGAWTAREDKILKDYIKIHGEGRWRNLPKNAGLKRCGKSCRLRWLNYLRPDIKRGNISPDEEELIIRLHKLLGNRWSLIAGRLPGRTDNEIKNYWNTNLVKKVQDQYTLSASAPKQSNQHNKSSESPFKMGSHVIKTKAVKCSKVFINPDSHNIQHSGTNTDAATSVDDNIPIFQSDSYNDTPSDFMMDLNLEDFSFSNLLNSEFSDSCGFSTHNGNELSPFPDHQQPLGFSDEEIKLLDNIWATDNDPATENVASYVSSFASFLDSREEWQLDDAF